MEVAATTGGDALKDFARISGMTEQEFVSAWKSDPIKVFQRFIESLAEMNEEGMSSVAVLDEIGISEIRLRDTMLRAVAGHGSGSLGREHCSGSEIQCHIWYYRQQAEKPEKHSAHVRPADR